jgi:hypothetical protein
MNSKLLLVLLATVSLTLTGCGQRAATGDPATPLPGEVISLVDKVEVVNFHATQRCASCDALGRLSRETVYEFFQPELRDGKVSFLEVNVDLPENKELAVKYQARGSSLYLNAVSDGQDKIEEDIRAWRLLADEAGFKDYLKGRINQALGK